ncbi:hypothetical protein FC64_GL001128 [Ligilactobacillus araffinosus DSM 20653]|uniref:Uncharacterized protein n=2 Tax=Ligilactobacillus araffinosus TaxID=147809 RepID=A0A0R1ZAW3_9LACO|nr:hypothetical protein FC64_GL001128 [Ligilactobacillus araffinosus DSM 20653]
MTMTKEKSKNERGVFRGRSPLFKKIFVNLAVGYILTGLIGSTWCAQEVFKGAAFFCVLFSLGTVYVFFIIPEILMLIALKNKSREVVIASVIINMFYLLVLCGLIHRPRIYVDEAGMVYHYAFGWRFIALSCLILSVALGILLLILINHEKWSLKKNMIALLITVIVSCGLVGGIGILTLVQRHSTLEMMKEQYVKNCESTENDQLSELSSDVVGIKTVKFAVVPTSKITLSSTDICGIDSDHSDLQDNVVLIEINGKPISNDDHDYLIGQEDDNEPFSKRQDLAAKYGLTMRKHGKPARQSVKQVKKTEVDWTEKQIEKYQGIGK